MSTIEKVTVKSRTEVGTTACRRLRSQGLVPANVYGHKEGAVPVSLDGETLDRLIRSGTHVVDLELNGELQKALLKDLQWDTYSTHILHVDFQRVDPNERVTVELPIHLRGTAPGVVAGGTLEQPHHTVEAECLAVGIPDYIQIRISSLNIGDIVHVKDLTEVPPGVNILTPPDSILVSIVAPAAEEAEAEDAEENASDKEGGEGE